MNITLNLATRPYIELRAVYARLRLFSGVLVVLALPMLLVMHSEETKGRLAEARVSQLQANIAHLRQQETAARNLASEGPNANVLNQAAFLNELFRHKAFSWTATMSDLETTLPNGVQVMGIEPVVAPDGRVTIRMRVTGPRDRSIEVIRNLEHSRHFVAPRLVSEGLDDQTGARARNIAATGGAAGDVSFDIIAGYRPLPNSHDDAGVVAAAKAQTQAATPDRPQGVAEVRSAHAASDHAPAQHHRAGKARKPDAGTAVSKPAVQGVR